VHHHLQKMKINFLLKGQGSASSKSEPKSRKMSRHFGEQKNATWMGVSLILIFLKKIGKV